MRNLVVCVLVAYLAFSEGRHEKYEGHQLFRIRGPAAEIDALGHQLDILKARPAAERSVSNNLEALVRLSLAEKEQWFPYFEEHNFEYKLVAENLAEILRDEDKKIQSSKLAAQKSGKRITWDTYYNHQEINDHLDALAAEYPDLVTVINAGLSYEGRQIKYVRISTTRFEVLRKPVFVIDAAIHARDWVSPPVALYIIHQLVVELADSELTEECDWIIIPVGNPDGYEYSINEDRLWHKTRSLSHDGSDDCPGVDGNRNFDFVWGTDDAASDACSPAFEGPTAFSEPETRVIRDVVLQQLNRAAMYISLQSHGGMLLYSWGNNATLPSNGLILHLAGTIMATAIDILALPEADFYRVGNAAAVLHHTTGASHDWARAVGVPLTYTMKLPDYDHLFAVPPEYIEQIVTESWAGIAAGAHYVLRSI